MPSRIALLEKDAARKRKTHTKSRRGCGNCKLRRVKCDEVRPRCKRCVSFGVSCNYDLRSADLQPSLAGAFNIQSFTIKAPPEAPSKSPVSLHKTILGMLNASTITPPTGGCRHLPIYQFNESDVELLYKFQTRTVHTIGNERGGHIYRDYILKLAGPNPFLMHIVLTATLLHDRYLTSSQDPSLSTAIAFHYYRGAALFHDKLSQPVNHSEKDALWAAAALIGIIVFGYTDARAPAELWPLQAPSANDLSWLKLSDGKKAVWQIANPLREDSVFRMMLPSRTVSFLKAPPEKPKFECLPPGFSEMLDLDGTSTAHTNPYFVSACFLSILLDRKCNRVTILDFMSFIADVQPGFKQLLLLKDPRALLILAYWSAKLLEYDQWWIQHRVLIECQAICVYLERHYGSEHYIRKFLPYPKTMCGLDSLPSPTSSIIKGVTA